METPVIPVVLKIWREATGRQVILSLAAYVVSTFALIYGIYGLNATGATLAFLVMGQSFIGCLSVIAISRM